MEYCEDLEQLIEEEGEDGAWVDTHPTSTLEEKVSEMTMDDVVGLIIVILTALYFSLSDNFVFNVKPLII